MSRFTKQLEDGKEVAYGFDHAFGYFLDVFDGETEDGEDNIIVQESSFATRLTNGRMVELMMEYDLPEDHIHMVAMDLPIV